MEDWALPEINLALCNRCGACVAECPTGAVEMGPEGPFIARPVDCTYCTRCEAICPQRAITCTYEIVWGA
jgi:MinD superfamily P-loop ATPase